MMELFAELPLADRRGKSLLRDYLTPRNQRDFAGLFDWDDPDLWVMGSWSGRARRALHRLPATRYFFTEKNVEQMLTGSYGRYLLRVGRRLFSREPVTGPWLQMETFGGDGVADGASVAGRQSS
jgi:hypothetical protein